jgi:hypothetical protein
MKNLIQIIWHYFWIGIFIFASTLSCTHENTRENARKSAQNKQIKEQPKSRINVIESIDYNCGSNNKYRTFHRYQILEIDGHLYLTNSSGGIVHLESCPCKKNQIINNTYEK